MITKAEMEAAQHLMELSDEESSSLDIIKKRKIEEIFGKDDTYEDHRAKEMVIVRVMSPKKKKFRTLESIYKATRPIRLHDDETKISGSVIDSLDDQQIFKDEA
ncbi:unnamed protein product [Eruca vesicaria subsp. sativa]|uniref:Uncharacterized protein n=1 Tax=Eruca vesicaria subsp. sativa TaxID=29727 RepID=A0ABC8K838_ERUVS|nr:unnamed protein product [Eruca vesicaria subsp. sativa]